MVCYAANANGYIAWHNNNFLLLQVDMAFSLKFIILDSYKFLKTLLKSCSISFIWDNACLNLCLWIIVCLMSIKILSVKIGCVSFEVIKCQQVNYFKIFLLSFYYNYIRVNCFNKISEIQWLLLGVKIISILWAYILIETILAHIIPFTH